MKKISLGKCKDCQKRKARVRYSDEPIYALTHGFGITNICRQCYIARMQSALKGLKKGIKEQRELIKSGG